MISVRFAGGRELADALRKLPSERITRGVLRNALKQAAEPMREDMRTLAPLEPGAPDLRESMVISPATRRDDVKPGEVGMIVGPSRSRFYGFFQEFGTVHHGAQPFARPAFDQNVQKSLGILAAALWVAIRKKQGGVTGIRTGGSTL